MLKTFVSWKHVSRKHVSRKHVSRNMYPPRANVRSINIEIDWLDFVCSEPRNTFYDLLRSRVTIRSEKRHHGGVRTGDPEKATPVRASMVPVPQWWIGPRGAMTCLNGSGRHCDRRLVLHQEHFAKMSAQMSSNRQKYILAILSTNKDAKFNCF